MEKFVAPYYTESEKEQLNELQYPYSDKYATYDGATHQYILNSEYFYERGVDLEKSIEGNDPEKVKHFLNDLTRKCYLYVYTNSMRNSRDLLNYIIAKRGLRGWDMEEYRRMFLEALFIEGCYLLDNGDISSISGVDIDTMQNMSEDVVRNQKRDFHRDFIMSMRTLGLNYYGAYRFLPQGKNKEW